MFRSLTSQSQLGICLLILLLCSACPAEKPIPYTLSNPILMAFQHQIDFDSLLQIAVDDHSQKVVVSNGSIQLFNGYGEFADYYLWVKDSLLFVKIDKLYVSRRMGTNSKSGSVRYEKELRKERPAFFKKIPGYISASLVNNLEEVVYYDSSMRQYLDRSMLELFSTGVIPIDSLDWNGVVFGHQSHFKFRKGKLDGDFTIRDTIHQFNVKGMYKEGIETDNWEYADLQGNPQWTEFYDAGELQSVRYDSAAHLKRAPRLLTVQEMILLHQVCFYVFLILAVLMFGYYFRTLRSIVFPHQRQNIWPMLGRIVVSPAFPMATIILYVVTLAIFFTLLRTSLGWDLPFDFFQFTITLAVVYFPFGLLYYITTFRHRDIFWHSGLLCICLLVFEEHRFLKLMGANLF